MQVKENQNIAFTTCSKEYYYLLDSLTSACQGIRLRSILKEDELLCRKKEGIIDLYATKKSIVTELTIIKYTIKYRYTNIFTAGIHIARIRRRKITPLLGLLAVMRIAEKIPPPKGYAIINNKAEKLFLYGKDVFPANIIKLNEPSCDKGYVVVLNEYNDALGWGRIRRHQNTIYIQNIIDVGWYLRSGV